MSNLYGFKNGAIILNEPKSTYYSGQVMSGKIKFELEKPLTFSTINIVHLGDAKVQWTEKELVQIHVSVKERRLLYYRGHEQFFNINLCIYGGEGMTSLPIGGHTIPFTFQIPFNVPSSFTHDVGQVKYSVRAYLVYENGSTEELVKEYNVIAPLNLNHIKDAVQKPIELSFEKTNRSWFFTTKPTTVRIYIPMSGYCPGDTIPISVVVQNNPNDVINKIVFMLISKERYHSQTPPRVYKPPDVILSSKELRIVRRGAYETYAEVLKVPDMIAPNLEHCHIIDVNYFIKVKLVLAGWRKPLEDESEIRIGLVAINNSNVKSTHPMTNSLPISPVPDPYEAKAQKLHNEIKAEHPKVSLHTVVKVTTSTHHPIVGESYMSIAEIVDKNRHDPKIDLYTSHEMGFEQDKPKKTNSPINPIPSLLQNQVNIAGTDELQSD